MPGRPGRRVSRTRATLLAGLVGGLAVVALVWSGARPGGNVNVSPANPTFAASPTPGATRAAAFVSTGSMLAARVGQTATLLQDGRVLIAGGSGGGGVALASAELYDPATGIFAATGPMTVARESATDTLLADGRVLIAGGQAAPGGGGVLASAELYDSKSGTFSSTGAMASPRLEQTATLLRDGRVLMTGGLTRSGLPGGSGLGDVIASAELYDPTSGTFSGTGPLAGPRAAATATLLADGRVLIAGGADNLSIYGNADSSAELYDPRTGTFRSAGSMSISRLGATATLLPDGRVLIAGGNAGAVDVISPLASAEVFDPATGNFSPTVSMASSRYRHTATLLTDGVVLIAGGGEGLGSLASAELFDPASGTFRPTAPEDLIAQASTATLLKDGRVLFAGGWASGPVASAKLYRP